MWKLIDPKTKEIFRDGFPTQWEALRTAYKADGSRFKKAEALTIPEGTVVFRDKFHTVMTQQDSLKQDGSYGNVFMKKTQVANRIPFALVSY